jgi:hypothetical protein
MLPAFRTLGMVLEAGVQRQTVSLPGKEDLSRVDVASHLNLRGPALESLIAHSKLPFPCLVKPSLIVGLFPCRKLHGGAWHRLGQDEGKKLRFLTSYMLA